MFFCFFFKVSVLRGFRFQLSLRQTGGASPILLSEDWRKMGDKAQVSEEEEVEIERCETSVLETPRSRLPLPLINVSNVHSVCNKLDESAAERAERDRQLRQSNRICWTETWPSDYITLESWRLHHNTS